MKNRRRRQRAVSRRGVSAGFGTAGNAKGDSVPPDWLAQGRTEAILAEIARPGSTRETIAASYQLGIIDCEWEGRSDFIDWPTVNRALLARYTASGLNYIKQLAWKRR
jgi:hypothetical protein